MLTDLFNKIKAFGTENQRELFLAALVFLMSVASFGLGRLSVLWPAAEPITIAEPAMDGIGRAAVSNMPQATAPDSKSAIPQAAAPAGARAYVASKTGSAYHLPDCPGAKQIKEENKIWFATKEAAQAAGYKPAGNCPGL